jgi:hypothetical protein
MFEGKIFVPWPGLYCRHTNSHMDDGNCCVIFAIFLNQTVTGRRMYALGGNEEATRISGINVNK